MDMDVAALIVSVHVRAHECLVPREIFAGKFQPECLGFRAGEPAFRSVLRIKAEDVVMRLDFPIGLVLAILLVQLFALFIKSERIAVQPSR